MSKGVAITGMGIISAIGNNVAENYDALINERKGITRVDNVETIQRDEIMVGEVKFTNDELIAQLNLPPENNYSRTAMLGVIAAKEAIASAGITDIKKYKTGIVSGTSVGGMESGMYSRDSGRTRNCERLASVSTKRILSTAFNRWKAA